MKIKIPKNYKEMSIGGKLRLVNAVMLLIPMFLALIGVTVIYLTFGSGTYGSIADYFNETDNVDYAYEACEEFYSKFKTGLESGGNENPQDFDPCNFENLNSCFTRVTKNSKVLYETPGKPVPGEFDKYTDSLAGENEKQFGVIGDKIIFRGIIENDGNVYEIISFGNVESFRLIDKNDQLLSSWFKTNLVLLIIVIVIVHFMSNVFYKSIFKRVEYSLKILSDGVDKISEGNLDYHINYDRDDEFKPICDKFNLMTDKLRESVEMIRKQEQNRKEIIMSISHDLFSPLTSIKAYVEGIESGIAQTPEAQKKYLETIKTKANQIEKVVSELLVFSKLEFEEYAPMNEKINLKEYLEEYCKAVDDDYALKNIQISLDDCDNAQIMGDKSLISRMLTNIIDNSGKYCDKPVCHVSISLEKKKSECVLRVSDDGPGVPKENIEHIFEVFYRSDVARNKTSMGSGIGLSIVNNIATKALNGKIHAENKDSGGLEIIIELPTLG